MGTAATGAMSAQQKGKATTTTTISSGWLLLYHQSFRYWLVDDR